MIETTHLFPVLHQKLIELLRSLQPDDWNKKTIAKLWTVKDVAAHILDTNLRTLSFSRDKHMLQPSAEINTYPDLVEYLNKLNAEWVTASKRLSAGLITSLLEVKGKEYYNYQFTLDPGAEANFPVAWAGETRSKNWFHIARDYTENWHHQQQIRDATGKQDIMTKELFYPVMDTFMRGLPYTYRNTRAEEGTTIQFTIDTEIGGSWFISRNNNGWQLSQQAHSVIHASLIIQPDTAWKLFTKGISPAVAMETSLISGDEKLAVVGLTLVAVMA